LFEAPKGDTPPPLWVRAILVTTCTGVSFFHGSNDGQKGISLMMIILMTFLPLSYIVNPTVDDATLMRHFTKVEAHIQALGQQVKTEKVQDAVHAVEKLNGKLAKLDRKDPKQLFSVRKEILAFMKVAKKLNIEDKAIKADLKALNSFAEYAPSWTVFLISICLGLGTMIGWKRIVVTIGEKIGKTHLTYAQGASAELIAMSTIGLSTNFGLPVSTTHVLSSGVAGTMVAADGKQNLQKKTIQNILLAWILTLPVTILLAGGLYILLRMIL
jgi:PiT family inorganic phosphate transporter